MEALQEAIKQLTGAVNAQIEVTKKLEAGIQRLEQPPTPVERSTLPIPKSEDELKEISRLPDCVKELQVFDGNPTHYDSRVHSVESILKDYQIVRNKPIYRAILQNIRQKIRGQADAALISYNIFDHDWETIKKCLSLHYADKRDLRTLEFQLGSLTQRNMSVDELYATVNHQFSLIINKIKTEDYSPDTINVLIETYRNRALDVFIRGLNGEISKMLMIQRPQTLPEAYASCLEIQNLNFRSLTIHNRNLNNSVITPVNYMSSTKPPSLPVRKLPQQLSLQQKNAAYNIQHQQPIRAPPRPTHPKPPTPMEVDRSIQTKQVNYMNRPQYHQNNGIKRENDSVGHLRKQQRVFHMMTEEDEPQREDSDDYASTSCNDVNFDKEVFVDEEAEETSEVNFMKGASLAYLT